MAESIPPKVVLITGAGQRVGAGIARLLHAQGMDLIIHYRQSSDQAHVLCDELNNKRSNSVHLVHADLNNFHAYSHLITQALACWNRLDVLINNASSFFPTPLGHVTEEQWHDLFNSNLKAPFFLSQTAAPWLAECEGTIINIADIHGITPMKNYTVYCTAKAGLIMLTQSLAKELASKKIRVNAIAPGSILWPMAENELSKTAKEKILSRIPLKRKGTVDDIAKAVSFLIKDADYITGQVLVVDGGRSLSI